MAFCGKKSCCTSTGICGTVTHGYGELSDNGYWEFPCEECEKEEAHRADAKTSCWNETLERIRPGFSEILNEKKHDKISRAKALGRMVADIFDKAYDAGKYSK